ncbi:trypsin-like peptidase domain-containing protein [Roseimaritima ulvae]|uniref:Putative periplasmic serine endoprotease DegP-like n=1 Tax=Roseimaritima ulvae TaxID=980254 RepID=A0A5B9QJS3_9BACT|nr:trypsin-like peptidase domain-containing protein [Roseimaritima ulvae]QEG39367.1 putative periplasmic serine endoprotease DegP-like precursor [Roseimaritima ulvae]
MAISQLRALLFLTFTILVQLPSSAAELRKWTTSDGRFETQAELVEANESAVTLKRADRNVITLSISKLSKPDRDYVQAWLLQRKQSETWRPGIVPDVLGEQVDLLSMIDPANDTQAGKWERDANALVSSGSSRARILLPHSVSGSYQLRLIAQRQLDTGSLNIGLVVGGRHQVLAIVDYGRSKRSGLAWIDEKNEPANSTFYRTPVLTTGRDSEIVCTVHYSHLRVTCDGKTIIEWTGDPSRLTLHPNFKVPGDRLFLETVHGSFRISQVQYLPIRESELRRYKPRGKPSPADSVALIEHPLGHGSGFLAAPNLLVTNHHVIEDASADDLKIFFPGESDSVNVHAVLFADADRDLAILSLETPRAPLAVAYDGYVPQGESVQLRGNPTIGGGVTLRNAVVKGTTRSMVRVNGFDFLQVDAAIDSGSSGGPILNELDQVVGVIAMKATDEGEKLMQEGLARLDDSFKNKSRQQTQDGIAFGIPARDVAKALDNVRGMTAREAGRRAQLHENRVLFQRLATLAGIRLLEANVNAPEEMRRQAARVAASRADDDLLVLIPAEPARHLRSALQSQDTQNIIALLQQDMDKHLNTIRSSPYLTQASIRGFNALSQRIKAIERFAQRPGTDYRRFSTTMIRFQSDVTRLMAEIKEEL